MDGHGMACNTTYAASTRTAFVDIDIDPKQLVLVGAQARALHEGGSDSLLLLLYPLLHSPALEQFFSSTFRFQTHNHYMYHKPATQPPTVSSPELLISSATFLHHQSHHSKGHNDVAPNHDNNTNHSLNLLSSS